MLKGIDISNNNYYNLKKTAFADVLSADFVMMKASEGISYKDRYLDSFYNLIHSNHDGRPDPDKLYGFYHYARPEKGTAAASEAYFFLSFVSHHAGHCLYALDVEGGALKLSQNYLDQWVFDWTNTVFSETGVKPLIYCSASNTARFPKAASADCGLWVAKWSKTKPKKSEILPWSLWAMWQDSDGGGLLDSDYFNGNAETWRAYCKVRS